MLPTAPPPVFGQAGAREVVPLARQGFAASAHAHLPRLQLPFDVGEPGAECLEADGLGVPFSSGQVPAYPPGPFPGWHRQPGLDPGDAGQQRAALGL
jgi:hypothetical protein